MELLETAKRDEKEYKDGLAYKKQMGFIDKWPEYERFKAGDQWPAPTDRTKNLPRPVFNIIKMIQNHKVASVMNEQIKMVYSTEELDNEYYEDAATKFTRFSEVTWERIKQDELNEEMLESGSNIGTGALHYYWDNDMKGGNTVKYQGDMCGETIDPINIFFGNPQQRKVQKQPYIIISSRELVKNVKEIANSNGISQEIVEQIKPDKDTNDQGYDMAQVELTDSKKVTVLTRYWKQNGTVWFRKTASGIVIKKDTDTKLRIYPIAVMPWERRKMSIYGIGDTEGLIPNQKTINFLMAMQVFSVQLTGWPKMVYKKQAINPSKVTNAPGEMIEDQSPPGTEGIKYLTPGNVSNLAGELVDKFIEYTRELTGANDAATGNAPSAQLNATAIMLLQKASGVPIESIKRRFYQAMEDVGRIWEEFWKVKYNMPRLVKVKNDKQEDEKMEFEGSQYQGVEMSLKIDIGPSSSYSESLMMSSLDNMLAQGHITFEQYLKYVPKNVVPFRERLLKDIEEGKESDIALLTGMPPDQILAIVNAPPELREPIIEQLKMQREAMSQAPPLQPNNPQPMVGV